MIAFALYALFVLLRWPLEKRARERRENAEAAAKRQAAEDEQVASESAFGADRRDRYRNDPPPAPPTGRGRVEPRL
ncbi:hypothetical protein PspTeo4_25728 [Pseudomonas sp. Teo4]|nr:hypothetical protein [Pseudomonas sp. Teo4]